MMQTQNKAVSLQLSQSTLMRLIKNNAVNINDFQCLDKESKEVVRRSFLKSTFKDSSRIV
jgi:hypothetical protein